MKIMAFVLLSLVALAAPAAAESVARTFPVSLDRAWSTTEKVLRILGWEVDKADRAVGWITTESRKLDGEDYGVYAKGTRHRLRIHVRADGVKGTTVTVERSVFKRERILWIDNDETIATRDQTVERELLATIAKSL